MARAKILGGREHGCDFCGNTILKIEINDEIYYQCQVCGNLMKTIKEDDIIIYREEVELVGGMA